MQYLSDMCRRVPSNINHYYFADCYYRLNVIFTHDRKLFSIKFGAELIQTLPKDQFPQLFQLIVKGYETPLSIERCTLQS